MNPTAFFACEVWQSDPRLRAGTTGGMLLRLARRKSKKQCKWSEAERLQPVATFKEAIRHGRCVSRGCYSPSAGKIERRAALPARCADSCPPIGKVAPKPSSFGPLAAFRRGRQRDFSEISHDLDASEHCGGELAPSAWKQQTGVREGRHWVVLRTRVCGVASQEYIMRKQVLSLAAALAVVVFVVGVRACPTSRPRPAPSSAPSPSPPTAKSP